MGLFSKRETLPLTREEEAGDWTRQEVMDNWRTIPDSMKVAALAHATEDQLRVMGWHLPNPHDRFLAIVEAKQRRDRPDLRRKIDEGGELSPKELQDWIAPLTAMSGQSVTASVVDQHYGEVFDPPR